METQLPGQSKAQASREFSKKLLVLAVTGGAAFWIIAFIISVSPIAADYKAAFSISSLPVALVEAFAGGLMIAFFFSFFLLRFFDWIPDKKLIFKALIISLGAMILVEILSTLVNPNNAYVYLLVDTGMNSPRFLALGLVIGFLFDRLKGKV